MLGCTPHTRSAIRTAGFCCALLFCIADTTTFAREPWPADLLDDADLHDVHFVNADEGWAVGDRGAILHTGDGGTTWKLQTSTIGDSLRGVYFVDTQHGWAVGGSAVPHMDRGRGIMLRTDNGGRTWLVEKNRTLPALVEVRFFDSKLGVAIGDASPLYPAGAFTTRDGGRSWNPFPVRTAHGWTAVDYRAGTGGGKGLLLSSAGHITTCEGANCRARTTPGIRQGQMRDIAWINADQAIAVGDGGTIWTSNDGAVHWKNVSRDIATRVANVLTLQQIDLHTVAIAESRIWIGGDPGSHILHSPDAGKSWEAFPLNRSANATAQLPISKMTIDTASGSACAVGPLGQIRSASGSLKDWKTVRGAERRLFALAVFGDERDVTWPLLAQIAGGYGGRLRILVAKDPQHLEDRSLAMSASHRLHQATLAVGGNNAVAQTGADSLANTLARSIPAWRPTLLITSGSDSEFAKSLCAAAQAADPNLPVWCSEWQTGQTNGFVVSPMEVARPMGASLGELTAASQSILGLRVGHGTHSVRCYPVGNSNRVGGKLTDSFSFAPGSSPRRASLTLQDDQRRLEQSAQQHALLRQVIHRAVAASDHNLNSKAWLAQIENMSSRLSSEAAARVMYDLAQRQFAAGHATAALSTLDALAKRHAGSDLYDATLRDAVRWLTSQEAAYRAREDAARKNATEATPDNSLVTNGVDALETPTRAATWNSDAPHEPSQHRLEESVQRGTPIPVDRLIKGGPTIADQLNVHRAVAISPNSNANNQAMELAYWLERMGPEHRADPELQIAMESYRRRVQLPGVRQQAVYQRLARTLPHNWQDCAAAELALLAPDRDPTKALLLGNLGDRPHLDGRFDIADKTTWPVLTSAEPSAAILIPLGNPLEPEGVAMLAADERFLYLGLRCKVPGKANHFAQASGPRTHDADLVDHDRVDFLIDTDRDYSLVWRLTVDHRGWTGESLGDDASWNPKWYVASGRTPDEWTCEAAIAWSQLGDERPSRENPWALTVDRHLPTGQTHRWPPDPSHSAQRLEKAGLFYFVK